jgi:AcrR family transcriptional regulator
MADNNHKKSARIPRSLTKKGRQSREALLDASRRVFEEQGFYSASVAEISRTAGMSHGAFYQYFKNKEQVFLELNDLILERFWEKASVLTVDGLDSEERLHRVVDLLFDHCRQYYFFHRILGEFELIDPVTIGYFDSLARFCRSVFRREIDKGFSRPLDSNLLSYCLLGIATFQAMQWGPDGESYAPGDLVGWTVRLLTKGLSGPAPWPRPTDLTDAPAPSLAPPRRKPLTQPGQGPATARAIIEAAESVFGEWGFNHAGISEITRLAGVAQGTFYVHFKSKHHLMEQFVKYLSGEMRFSLKTATQHLTDRRDAERVGIISFFRFLSKHRRIYRVVAESETMGQEMAMWYYKKLAQGYQPGLIRGQETGQIRDDLPVPFMARSIMGLIHMVGLKWLVWNSSPQAAVPKQIVEDAITLIIDGLAPA